MILCSSIFWFPSSRVSVVDFCFGVPWGLHKKSCTYYSVVYADKFNLITYKKNLSSSPAPFYIFKDTIYIVYLCILEHIVKAVPLNLYLGESLPSTSPYKQCESILNLTLCLSFPVSCIFPYGFKLLISILQFQLEKFLWAILLMQFSGDKSPQLLFIRERFSFTFTSEGRLCWGEYSWLAVPSFSALNVSPHSLCLFDICWEIYR